MGKAAARPAHTLEAIRRMIEIALNVKENGAIDDNNNRIAS